MRLIITTPGEREQFQLIPLAVAEGSAGEYSGVSRHQRPTWPGRQPAPATGMRKSIAGRRLAAPAEISRVGIDGRRLSSGRVDQGLRLGPRGMLAEDPVADPFRLDQIGKFHQPLDTLQRDWQQRLAAANSQADSRCSRRSAPGKIRASRRSNTGGHRATVRERSANGAGETPNGVSRAKTSRAVASLGSLSPVARWRWAWNHRTCDDVGMRSFRPGCPRRNSQPPRSACRRSSSSTGVKTNESVIPSGRADSPLPF